MKRSLSKISMILGATGMLAAGLGATATAANAATAPAWHRLLTVSNGSAKSFDGSAVSFDAVVATGKTTGWGFRSDSAVAYERTGANAWRAVAFPGKTGTVVAAAGTSPSNVWVGYNSATGSEIYHWNGHAWSAVRSFAGYVSGLSVLGSADVWVYGGLSTNENDGIWHYNGHKWTEVSSVFQGGSALSDKNVWAYSGGTIEHFNGSRWTATSVAKLLPANGAGVVASVVALSADNVYATGNGGSVTHGGGVTVLHYNGRGWSKVASSGLKGGEQATSDGHGGLWVLAVGTNEELLHYSGGKLTQVNVPYTKPHPSSQPIEPTSIALIPGTTGLLVGGYQYLTTTPSFTSNSYVLQYS
jgi:hypothetical protein